MHFSVRVHVPFFVCLYSILALSILVKADDRQVRPVQLHGLNYNTRQGPDWDWNKCKSRPQIQTELALLRRLTSRIRILSLKDCDQGVLVTSVAKEMGMQLWLGLWVGPEPWVFEEEKGTLQYMINQGMFNDDTVIGITVGSEAIYREDATVSEMIENLNQGVYDTMKEMLSAHTRSLFLVYGILRNAGITDVPVTVVDVAPVYSASPALRRAVNVTMTNTFPFWEGIPIEGAVADLQLDLDWLLNLPESRNKPFVLGETGWPSDGFIEGVGKAGTAEQRRYFQEAYCRMHVENQWAYYWFTGIDNAWRQEQDPENTIEGNWGFLYADLSLKEHFVDFSFRCSDGNTYSFAELDFTIPTGFTPSPVVIDPASCQAHSRCAELFGNCCPNDSGLLLGCCDMDAPRPTPTSAPVRTVASTPNPTAAPSANPTSKEPTLAPTSAVSSVRATSAPTMPNPIDTGVPSPFPTRALTSSPMNAPPPPSTMFVDTLQPNSMILDTPTTLLAEVPTSRPAAASFPPSRLPITSTVATPNNSGSSHLASCIIVWITALAALTM